MWVFRCSFSAFLKALEDAARFVAYVSACDPAAAADGLSTPPLRLPAATWASAWVAFGGSYPGSLATWLKLKYPSLLRGAVGSSAPVFAEYDYVQYAEVGRSYWRSGAWMMCAPPRNSCY
jgi:pimeloyl-ACP methyl ester carboxylesterase